MKYITQVGFSDTLKMDDIIYEQHTRRPKLSWEGRGEVRPMTQVYKFLSFEGFPLFIYLFIIILG